MAMRLKYYDRWLSDKQWNRLLEKWSRNGGRGRQFSHGQCNFGEILKEALVASGDFTLAAAVRDAQNSTQKE